MIYLLEFEKKISFFLYDEMGVDCLGERFSFVGLPFRSKCVGGVKIVGQCITGKDTISLVAEIEYKIFLSDIIKIGVCRVNGESLPIYRFFSFSVGEVAYKYNKLIRLFFCKYSSFQNYSIIKLFIKNILAGSFAKLMLRKRGVVILRNRFKRHIG